MQFIFFKDDKNILINARFININILKNFMKFLKFQEVGKIYRKWVDDLARR